MENENRTPINVMQMVDGKVSIPMTNIKPANHRCFLVPFVEPEKKSKTGLIIPSSITVKDRHKNDIPVDRLRYFVAAVSEDFSFDLKVGDEIYPLIFDGTTLIELPRIFDYANDNFEYLVIHDTEIMGYKSNQPKNKE